MATTVHYRPFTPYSKILAILLFFYIYVNWPSLPRFHFQNSKKFYLETRHRGPIIIKTKEYLNLMTVLAAQRRNLWDSHPGHSIGRQGLTSPLRHYCSPIHQRQCAAYLTEYSPSSIKPRSKRFSDCPMLLTKHHFIVNNFNKAYSVA